MNSRILRLTCYIELFYTDILFGQNEIVEYICNTLTVSCKKSKRFFSTSSMMKSNAAPNTRSRFSAKLNYCIAFVSASSACCYLESIDIIV